MKLQWVIREVESYPTALERYARAMAWANGVLYEKVLQVWTFDGLQGRWEDVPINPTIERVSL